MIIKDNLLLQKQCNIYENQINKYDKFVHKEKKILNCIFLVIFWKYWDGERPRRRKAATPLGSSKLSIQTFEFFTQIEQYFYNEQLVLNLRKDQLLDWSQFGSKK